MNDRALEADLLREPLFEAEAGATIASPVARGAGHWAGAPGAVSADGAVFLCYRLRAPAPDRGHTLVVARSEDGSRFEPVWQASRDDLGALSIERCAIARIDGTWRLLVSHVASEDRRWRIEAIEARTIEQLDPRARRPVLLPHEIGVAAVKDPWLRRHDGRWHMFVSFGAVPSDASGLHASGDALSTGRILSMTGLATSADGARWEWRGAVVEPSAGRWDDHTSRLSTALRLRDGWLGLYDGSRLEENYEERCGLAFSDDLIRWRKASVDGPVIGTATGPGGVRYVDVCEMPDGTRRAYYEYTRSDGSHELRTAVVRDLARNLP